MSGPIRPPLKISDVADGGSVTGRPINVIQVTDGTLSVSGTTATITTGGGGGGSGTVTSVAVSVPAALSISGSPITTSGTIAITGAGTTSQYIDGTGALQTTTSGTVTSVSGSTPISSSGGATPAISISQSDATTNGYLSSTDWSDFDGKQDAITLTTTGTSGAATLVGATLNIPQYALTAAPAGSDGNLQYNNSGTLGGLAYVNRVNTGTERGLSLGETGYEGLVTTPSGLDLVLNTNSGTDSGAIVIREGANGQITITPDGTGTIKLDGVELDNSAIATGYVLKATSTSAAGWAAESGGGGGQVLTYPTQDETFATSDTQYANISAPYGSSVSTTQSLSASWTRYIPIMARRDTTFSTVVCNLNSAPSSAATIDMGIYESNADNLPGDLIAQGSAAGVTTSGTKELTLTAETGKTLDCTEGATYFIACVHDQSITFNGSDARYASQYWWGSNNGTTWSGVAYENTATLPATASTGGISASTNIPSWGVKYGS